MLWAGDIITFIHKNLVWGFFDTGGLFLVNTVIIRYRGDLHRDREICEGKIQI